MTIKKSGLGMKNITRGFLALVAFCGLAGQPANAQQIKPLTVDQDANGVDMLSGKTSPRVPALSIPAAPRLSFSKLYDWHMFLEGEVIAGATGSENLSLNTLGHESENFNCRDLEICTDKKAGGSVMFGDRWSGYYEFTKGGSGVKVIYNLRDKSQGAITTGPKFYFLATSVQFPDGENLSMNWTSVTPYSGFKDHRPASVVSSTGYTLKFTYQSNTYGSSAWSTLQKAEIVKTSAPTVALASFTYTDTTITDIAGRVYNCTNCRNWLGGPQPEATSSLKLPGEAVTSFTASAVPQNYGAGTHANFTSDIDVDGVHYDYNYVESGTYFPRRFNSMSVTGPSGFARTVTVEHSTSGSKLSRVKSVKDELNRTTTYGYGGLFLQLTSVVYPEGNSMQLTYDGPVNIKEMRQKAKPGSGLADIVQTADYTRPPNFECIDITCFLPNWTRDAKGNQTDYTWASHGGMLTQLDPVDANGERRKTKYTYDSAYRPTKEEVCAANSAGTELTCGTASSFVKNTTYYGGTRLPLSESVTNGVNTAPLTTVYTYDDAGRVLSQDGPLPGIDDAVYYGYDMLGRKISEIGPRGESGHRTATRTTYRPADDKPSKVETGRVASASNAVPNISAFVLNSQVDTVYDSRRLPVKTTVSASGTSHAVSQMSYDSRNREDCTAIRMNPAAWGALPANACTPGTEGTQGPDRITRKIYDNASQLTKIQQAYGTTLAQDYATYTYSNNGKQTSVTDARGYKASMTYDGFDRQTKWNFPSKTATNTVSTTDYEQYGYDANGNRISLRKRDGSTLTFAYDNLNRVTVKTVPARTGLAATHTQNVYYQYDIRGLQTRARFGGINGWGSGIAYDQYGRKTIESLWMDGVNRDLNYSYDTVSNRTSITHPDNAIFTYTYGSGGQFNQLLDPYGHVLVDYNYNDRNELTGAARLAEAPDQTSTYDPIGRLASTGWANAGANSIAWSFTRNPASQILTETQTNDSYSWNAHVVADRTYAANGLNQYTQVANNAYCYDPNGNLTADGSNVYLYDIENRMVEMRSQVGGACPTNTTGYTGQIKASLRYDPLGRLHETIGYVNGVSQGARRYLHDGDALVAEYNSANTMTARHIHGPSAGSDDPLVSYTSGSTAHSEMRLLYADARGSIVYSTLYYASPAINTYDEYGLPGTANTGRFQYTGQAWLPELGMYHYKARLYSPALGRFMQTDPIGYEDGLNIYAYVANDPVNGVDPSGLCSASRIDAAENSICGGSGSITLQVTGSSISNGERSKKVSFNLKVHRTEARDTEQETANDFASENNGAIEGLSRNEEMFGLALRFDSDGKFVHTEGKVVSSNFEVTVNRLINGAGLTPTAAIHSHPFNGGEGFSSKDIGFVRQANINYYLRTPTGRFRVLTPRKARYSKEGDAGQNACMSPDVIKCFGQ